MKRKMRDYLLRVFEYFHLLQNMLFPRRSSRSSSKNKKNNRMSKQKIIKQKKALYKFNSYAVHFEDNLSVLNSQVSNYNTWHISVITYCTFRCGNDAVCAFNKSNLLDLIMMHLVIFNALN